MSVLNRFRAEIATPGQVSECSLGNDFAKAGPQQHHKWSFDGRLLSVTNTGGHGLHGEPAQHDYIIESLIVYAPEGAAPWEDHTSLGWTLDGKIVAVRDAKIMDAVRVVNSDGDSGIAIIHPRTRKMDWLDNPWGADKGFLEASREDQVVPGGRMYAWRIVECDESAPHWVALDSLEKLPRWDVARQWLGNHAHPHEMPPYMVEWIEKFADLEKVGEDDWRDEPNAMSFVGYYGQTTGRFETWNMDPNLRLGNVPEGYVRHPFVWPAPVWSDGIHNNHYNLVTATLREYYRWIYAGDGPRAAMCQWLYSRLAQWQVTSAICWSTDSRYYGYQWGEKSDRAGKRMWVGGFPGNFALTPQKQYAGNQFAAAAQNTSQGWLALSAFKWAVLSMGPGDIQFGVRDVFWTAESNHFFLTAAAAAAGNPSEDAWAAALRKSCEVLAQGRDFTGLWPNYQETPTGVTNTFETCQGALTLMKARIYNVIGEDYDDTIDEVMVDLKARCVYVSAGKTYPVYRWSPDGVEGIVDNGTDHINGPDTSEFTRPYMMVALGAHALLGGQGSEESRALFLNWYPRCGEYIDWKPPVQISELEGDHVLGGSLVTTRIDPDAVRPKKPVNFAAGKHYNGIWKVASSTFEFADEIGIIYRELMKGGDQ